MLSQTADYIYFAFNPQNLKVEVNDPAGSGKAFKAK